MTFSEEECYLLFIAMDNWARERGGDDQEINKLRDQLLPAYVAWHKMHPREVHPSAKRGAHHD
jgi:hypothetical protein